MAGSLEKVNERKVRKKLKEGIYTKQEKNEDCFRYLRDFSPTVEFKSDQYDRALKLSRHMLLSKLRHDISSKHNEMFGSAIQIRTGLYQIIIKFSRFESKSMKFFPLYYVLTILTSFTKLFKYR